MASRNTRLSTTAKKAGFIGAVAIGTTVLLNTLANRGFPGAARLRSFVRTGL